MPGGAGRRAARRGRSISGSPRPDPGRKAVDTRPRRLCKWSDRPPDDQENPRAHRQPPLPHAGADPGRRRLLGALFGAPLATVGLAGCGGAEETPVDDGLIELSVFWYGSTKRAELTEKALRLYSARNPRVSFRVTWQGFDGYYDRLATQAAGGNVPDLIQVDDTVLTEYARRDILLDLGGYAADNRLDLRGLPRAWSATARSTAAPWASRRPRPAPPWSTTAPCCAD